MLLHLREAQTAAGVYTLRGLGHPGGVLGAEDRGCEALPGGYLRYGDDWAGKFDFLKPLCEVVYLERTPEISTTQIKEELGR